MMSNYAIPTITRITEQGNPCLLPYVINVSCSDTHNSSMKPSSLSAFLPAAAPQRQGLCLF